MRVKLARMSNSIKYLGTVLCVATPYLVHISRRKLMHSCMHYVTNKWQNSLTAAFLCRPGGLCELRISPLQSSVKIEIGSVE